MYKPGKELYIANTLSRSCEPRSEFRDDVREEDGPMRTIATVVIRSEQSRKTYRDATLQDPQLQDLLVHVKTGWPEAKKHCTACSNLYWDVRTEITEYDGLLFKDERLIIPSNMIPTILKDMHTSHEGIVKTTEMAKTSL